MFSLCLKKSSFKLLEKNSPSPTRKPKGLSRKKSNLESIPPYLLYQAQQQHFKNGLMLWALYHVFHLDNYISCISWLSPVSYMYDAKNNVSSCKAR